MSILDDLNDVIDRTETILHKEAIEKFLSTYCMSRIVDGKVPDRPYFNTVSIQWWKIDGYSHPRSEMEDAIYPVELVPVSNQNRFFGDRFLTYSNFTLSTNGYLKPTTKTGSHVQISDANNIDTILIKGYPFKELPPYIKFEPETSSKSIKVICSNCPHDFDIPGVKPENIVRLHHEYKLVARQYY